LHLGVSGLGLAVLASCGAPASPAPAAAPTPASQATPAAGPATTAPAPVTTSATAATAATAAPGSNATPLTPDKAASTAQGAAQPRYGGLLRTAVPSDISKLDGHVDGGGTRTTFTQNLGLAFDQLVFYDASLQPHPMLAESWDVSDDYKQVKLNLRKGVQWHSGRDFTSDDVKYNLFRGRDPKAGVGTYVNQSKWFQSIDTPDKYTAICTSDVARPSMFDYFNALSMVDQATQEGPDAGTRLVGTGPFTFVEWVQGDHLTFAKNKNYWRSDLPYLDGVQVSIVKDLSAMTTRLEAGGLDGVFLPSLADFVRLKADPAYNAVTPLVTVASLAIGANTLFAPNDDLNVRRALNYAIDRKRFTDTSMDSTVQPLSLPWDVNSLAYEAGKANYFTYDLDKARSLLAEAGVAGFEMDILPSAAQPELALFCQIYQSDLANLGIKLNIKNLEPAAWVDEVNNRRYHGMWASTVVAPLGEPASAYTNSRGTDPVSNNEGYKSERYSQLIASAATEPDVATRKQIYAQLNDIVIDDSFVMFLCPYPVRMVTRAGLHDVVSAESPGTFLFTHAWLQ
jgi:peptide/nickel transport system substrate-binding protein